MRTVALPIILVLLVALGPGLAEEMEPLALEAAIDRALAHNLDLARAALGIQQDEWGVRGAEAEFAFRIRPNSYVGFSSEQEEWQYGLAVGKRFGLGTAIDVGSAISRTLPEDADDIERTTIAIQLSQPLFRNFGRLMQEESLVQAGHLLKQTRRNYEQQQADLVLDVVETFETILQLSEQLAAERNLFERTDQLYRLTRARERQGRATRIDALRVELQRGEALGRVESVQESLSFTQREFAELLGYPPDKAFTLVPPPLLDVTVPPAEEAVQIALAHRLDYAQALQDLEDEERGVRIARRRLLPDLSLVTRFEQFGEGATFEESSRLDEQAWTVGLRAESDFNPARERAALHQTQFDHESARQAIQIQERVIAREVQQELTAYRRARTELKIAQRNVRLAEDRVVLARRLFQLGRGDNFSATDAEEAFSRAQTSWLRKRAEAAVAGYRLKHTLGTLVAYPDSLRPRPRDASS